MLVRESQGVNSENECDHINNIIHTRRQASYDTSPNFIRPINPKRCAPKKRHVGFRCLHKAQIMLKKLTFILRRKELAVPNAVVSVALPAAEAGQCCIIVACKSQAEVLIGHYLMRRPILNITK